MNVVPGGSFFQTVQGSAASNGPAQSVQAARPSEPTHNARAAENPGSQLARPPSDTPRGRILDIVV